MVAQVSPDLCQGPSHPSSESPLERARHELQREWRMRAALEALYELAGADGVVLLTGGVRGWAETLGCSPGWPRKLLAELERRTFVDGVEIYPGEGGLVAEVHLFPVPQRSVIDQRPPAATRPAPPEIAGSHQDATQHVPDSISDRSPPTPPNKVLNHDSMQQQQHAHARVAEGLEGPERSVLSRLLRADFPDAAPALLATWEADPAVDLTDAAYAALAGRPEATAEEWAIDLARAKDRPEVETPIAFVLAIWAGGGRVSPRRSSPLVERPQQAARRQVAPSPAPARPDPAPPPAPRRLDDAAPPTVPRASPAERERLRLLQFALGQLQAVYSSKDLMDWGLNRAQVAQVADGAAVISLPGYDQRRPPQKLLDAFRRVCRDALRVGRVELVDPAAYAAAAD